jgi:hypothetical protein
MQSIPARRASAMSASAAAPGSARSSCIDVAADWDNRNQANQDDILSLTEPCVSDGVQSISLFHKSLEPISRISAELAHREPRAAAPKGGSEVQPGSALEVLAASTRVAIAYWTCEVGNYGWQWRDIGTAWSVYEMVWNVPKMKVGNGDFIGPLPEKTGAPGVEIHSVRAVGRKRAEPSRLDRAEKANMVAKQRYR